MVGLKNGLRGKYLTQNGEAQRYSWATQKKKEKKKEKKENNSSVIFVPTLESVWCCWLVA